MVRAQIGGGDLAVGPPSGSGRPGPGTHYAAVPGDVVGGHLPVEMDQADGEEGQQPGHGHIAPQEGAGGPQQAAQLAVHFLPEPAEGAMGTDIWGGALLWPPGPGALGKTGPPALQFSHKVSTIRGGCVLPGPSQARALHLVLPEESPHPGGTHHSSPLPSDPPHVGHGMGGGGGVPASLRSHPAASGPCLLQPPCSQMGPHSPRRPGEGPRRGRLWGLDGTCKLRTPRPGSRSGRLR